MIRAGGEGAAGTSVADRLAAGIFALLVLASFAAFFVVQHLKHSPTLIHSFTLEPNFAPTRFGHNRRERLSIQTAQTDRITVSIIDAEGGTARTLVKDKPLAAYHDLRLSWDGLEANGDPAPVGTYEVEVTFSEHAPPVRLPRTFKLYRPTGPQGG